MKNLFQCFHIFPSYPFFFSPHFFRICSIALLTRHVSPSFPQSLIGHPPSPPLSIPLRLPLLLVDRPVFLFYTLPPRSEPLLLTMSVSHRSAIPLPLLSRYLSTLRLPPPHSSPPSLPRPPLRLPYSAASLLLFSTTLPLLCVDNADRTCLLPSPPPLSSSLLPSDSPINTPRVLSPPATTNSVSIQLPLLRQSQVSETKWVGEGRGPQVVLLSQNSTYFVFHFSWYRILGVIMFLSPNNIVISDVSRFLPILPYSSIIDNGPKAVDGFERETVVAISVIFCMLM